MFVCGAAPGYTFVWLHGSMVLLAYINAEWTEEWDIFIVWQNGHKLDLRVT